MARDPVCGVQVNAKAPALSVYYKGTTYFFCTAACKAAFEKNPTRYTARTGIYMTVGH